MPQIGFLFVKNDIKTAKKYFVHFDTIYIQNSGFLKRKKNDFLHAIPQKYFLLLKVTIMYFNESSLRNDFFALLFDNLTYPKMYLSVNYAPYLGTWWFQMISKPKIKSARQENSVKYLIFLIWKWTKIFFGDLSVIFEKKIRFWGPYWQETKISCVSVNFSHQEASL